MKHLFFIFKDVNFRGFNENCDIVNELFRGVVFGASKYLNYLTINCDSIYMDNNIHKTHDNWNPVHEKTFTVLVPLVK